MAPKRPSPPVPPAGPVAKPAPKRPSPPTASRQPSRTSVVNVILDEPTESDDKFELQAASGSYRETLKAADAKPLVAGEKILTFKIEPDSKGYRLLHHRSDDIKRIIFLETRLQDMTKAGVLPNSRNDAFEQFPSQVPNRLPDPYKNLSNVDPDLVQDSPVLVNLKVKDPE